MLISIGRRLARMVSECIHFLRCFCEHSMIFEVSSVAGWFAFKELFAKKYLFLRTSLVLTIDSTAHFT